MSIKHYGQTSHEKDAAESIKCREIVQEIRRFGVNQNQIVKIIQFLAMELEDRELMIKIVNLTKEEKDAPAASQIIT